MHDCTYCEGACYCDMEDHQSPTPDDCGGCGCDDDDDDEQWWEEEDDDDSDY